MHLAIVLLDRAIYEFGVVVTVDSVAIANADRYVAPNAPEVGESVGRIGAYYEGFTTPEPRFVTLYPLP